ncbi:MAG TPA: DUF4384 domain-containing protein [Bryobacterales bacterium]|jgi:hypothetical protein|nr:DUF4384 domain-containing protein [Bryobacterales bacterium]
MRHYAAQRIVLVLALLTGGDLLCFAQRGAKQSARDLFYSEAGLIVSSQNKGRGRFGAAKQSTVAVALGLKYRIWTVSGEQAVEADPAGLFSPGDVVRLGVEVNDAGYLYVVQWQPGGAWKRLFPTPEIEQGSQFVRSGIVYSIPAGGRRLDFSAGLERILILFARQPIRELEPLIAAPGRAGSDPVVADAILEKARKGIDERALVTETAASEKCVYVVNRTGKPDSALAAEIRLSSR